VTHTFICRRKRIENLENLAAAPAEKYLKDDGKHKKHKSRNFPVYMPGSHKTFHVFRRWQGLMKTLDDLQKLKIQFYDCA